MQSCNNNEVYTWNNISWTVKYKQMMVAIKNDSDFIKIQYVWIIKKLE